MRRKETVYDATTLYTHMYTVYVYIYYKIVSLLYRGSSQVLNLDLTYQIHRDLRYRQFLMLYLLINVDL